MFSLRKHKMLLVMACVMVCVICSVFFINIPTIAQIPPNIGIPPQLQKTVFQSPGYYYVGAGNVTQHRRTAAITLTISAVTDDYPTGLQVIFKTEKANTNNGPVTLRINSLDAKKLLTRHGQEFRILELDAGIIMTATYDGNAFISDYVAARSLKGRPIATLDIAAGSYNTLQYLGAWTLETGVTGFSVEDIPGGITFGNPNPAVDALLALPTDRTTDSQLGWFIEVLNGTTVVNTIFKNFGSYDAFGTRVATDVAGIVFEFDFRANGLGQTSPYMAFLMVGSEAIPAGYSIKVYLSEN